MEENPYEPAPASAPAVRNPWGFWASSGLGVAVLGVFLVSQLSVAGVFMAFSGGSDADRLVRDIGFNGDVISFAILASTIVCSLLILLLVKLRRGPSATDYLGLMPVSARTIAKWLALALAYGLLYDRFASYLNRPIVPEFALAAYRSAQLLPLLWVALVVLAPLFEELFFRGFLLAGFRTSLLGNWGAILLTAASWAAIHLQYDLLDMGSIFVLGILFGYARTSTGSLWPCLAMHAAVNLVATAQTAYYA